MEVVQIKLTDIETDDNSRAKIGDNSALMLSIREEGLIVPLIVAPNFKDGSKRKYLLVAGNRRLDALTKLGMTSAPCVLRADINDRKGLMLTNLLENIQRRSTTPWEEGRFIRTLIDTFGMSKKEIAIRLGVAESYVKSALYAFSETPAKYRDKIVYSGERKTIPGKITLGTAKTIGNISQTNSLSAAQVDSLYSMTIREELSENQIKSIGRVIANGIPIDTALKISTNISQVRMDVSITKSQKKSLEKKYPNMTINQVLTKILRGEIKETIGDPLEARSLEKMEKTAKVILRKRKAGDVYGKTA